MLLTVIAIIAVAVALAEIKKLFSHPIVGAINVTLNSWYPLEPWNLQYEP